MLSVPARQQPLQLHHDARGWLCEVWRLDRLTELQEPQMRLLQLEAGERLAPQRWSSGSVSVTLCAGDASLLLGDSPMDLQVSSLAAPQTVVLAPGTWWSLAATSSAQFLCAVPGAPDEPVTV